MSANLWVLEVFALELKDQEPVGTPDIMMAAIFSFMGYIHF